jgi:hypothetical protein
MSGFCWFVTPESSLWINFESLNNYCSAQDGLIEVKTGRVTSVMSEGF